MKVLSVVETAYRATAEEQDDTIIWLSSMFKSAGLDLTVLLRANSVNYLVRGQDASGLSFGGRKVGHAPRLDEDIVALVEKGVPVFYVAEDVSERGIDPDRLVGGAEPLPAADIPAFLGGYDQVWHW